MTTRYTSNAVELEIHLSGITNWLGTTDGIDEEATSDRLSQFVRDTVQAAYPDASISVYGNQTQYHTIEIAACPDDVDEAEVIELIDQATDDYAAWCVESSEAK